MVGLSGIFFTVLVDTALLSDDLELLRLVLELLLSTSSLRLGIDLGRLRLCCDDSGLRSEAVRRGVELALREPVGNGATRNDLLRSRDCWFLASKVCSWFDARTGRRFGVSLGVAEFPVFSRWTLASSLQEDVVSEGVSDTRL